MNPLNRNTASEAAGGSTPNGRNSNRKVGG